MGLVEVVVLGGDRGPAGLDHPEVAILAALEHPVVQAACVGHRHGGEIEQMGAQRLGAFGLGPEQGEAVDVRHGVEVS